MEVQFTISDIVNSLGAWTFRVSRDNTNEFFLHILLLLIGESLTETLSQGLNPCFSNLNVDDDICGVSLSNRYSSNLVTIWNRIAPNTLPSSATTPHSGSLPFSSSPISEVEEPSPVERGVEKMKDYILAGLTGNMRPQSWYYRVMVLR
jgi:hypothetical protein